MPAGGNNREHSTKAGAALRSYAINKSTARAWWYGYRRRSCQLPFGKGDGMGICYNFVRGAVVATIVLLGCSNAAAAKAMSIGVNMTFQSPGNCYGCFRDDVNFADAWNSGVTDGICNTNVWKPEVLEDLSIFSTLRFMNWCGTNGNTASQWSDVHKPGDADNDNIGWIPNGAFKKPMAFEWMIDLCNRLHEDMWVNMLHGTDQHPEFWTNCATLIKETLDPSLKVYVEYSNETWNYGFSQTQYCAQRGAEVGLPGNNYNQGFLYHAYAAIRMWEAFEDVFGADNPRLVKVCAGHVAAFGVGQAMFDQIINNSTYNPNGTRPDAFAIAPYVGHSLDSGDPNVFTQLTSELDGMRDLFQQWKALCDREGVELVTYEGGMHVTHGGQSDVINRDDRMYDWYMHYHDVLSDYFALHMHYNYSGNHTPEFAWAAKECVGDPIDSPSAVHYRALYDWIEAHPTSVAWQQPARGTTAAAPRLNNVNARVFDIQGRFISPVSAAGLRPCTGRAMSMYIVGDAAGKVSPRISE